MSRGVGVAGVGITAMDRRDRTAQDMAQEAIAGAMSDAGLSPADIGLVVVANAMGGRLLDQGCIRGQAWLRHMGLGTTGVLNVDNSCAGGASAMHVGVMAVRAEQSPVLVVGVEKMWTGDRAKTLAGIEDGLPSEDRSKLRAQLDDDAPSILMGLNAGWVRHQIEQRGTTVEQIAATTVKARSHAARNPVAQFRTPVTADEVLASPIVAGPLRRLMCSSFTDGAAAAVLDAGHDRSAPTIVSSIVRSGNGDMEYHERLGETAADAWKASGIGPEDVDIAEIHDATSAEELYALEGLGFFEPGDAGAATASGSTSAGGDGLCVNPSGGLVGRGHPLAATGVAQIVELTLQMRGKAQGRQHARTRTGVAVNTGGILSGRDCALVAIHILQRN